MKKTLLCGVCVVLLAGCGSKTSNSTGTGGNGGYVAPAQTIFLGDVITQYWPLATSAAFDISVSNGTAFDFEEFAGKCESGCTPSALQADAPGMKRVVITVGEFDALQLCYGSTIDNPSADFSSDLDALVRSTQSVFGLQVWLGTVPPIYNSSGTQVCAAQTASINQQIAAVGAQEGATVVNLSGAIASSADTNLTLEFAGQGAGQNPIIYYDDTYYLPNATGFAAMTALYNQTNQ